MTNPLNQISGRKTPHPTPVEPTPSVHAPISEPSPRPETDMAKFDAAIAQARESSLLSSSDEEPSDDGTAPVVYVAIVIAAVVVIGLFNGFVIAPLGLVAVMFVYMFRAFGQKD